MAMVGGFTEPFCEFAWLSPYYSVLEVCLEEIV
jgi:hypothetical protein